MTLQHYHNGWLVYIASGICILLFCWRISRGMPHWLRYPLLCLGAAWLFTPFPIENGHEFMAPAFLMFMYEGLFLPNIGFVRTGPIVASVGLVSLFVYPALQLLWLPLRAFFPKRAQHDDDASMAAQDTENNNIEPLPSMQGGRIEPKI